MNSAHNIANKAAAAAIAEAAKVQPVSQYDAQAIISNTVLFSSRLPKTLTGIQLAHRCAEFAIAQLNTTLFDVNRTNQLADAMYEAAITA